jgi:phenylacetate-CoA ligase
MQNLVCTLQGYKIQSQRFNKKFVDHLEFLQKSEWWSKTEIDNYQNEKLFNLMAHVYNNVPYYKKIMDGARLKPSDFKNVDDLKKMPFLKKEDVRNHRDQFIAENCKRNELVFAHTSGTTGSSLQFFVSKKQIPFQWAVWWRHRMRFGILPGTLHANFTGKLVIPVKQKRPPYWRWNRPINQALLTMQHIEPGKIKFIMDFLNEHQFEYYSGYPSIIHMLCNCALDHNIILQNKPKFIFPGAENVLDYQKREIVQVTGATITDQYGFSEGCGNASHCTEFNYHEDFEFGIMEFIEEENLGDGLKRGKVVCTGFACPEFPFVRYVVGDSVVWEENATCACGRKSKIIKSIEGRIDDFVLTPEGRKIMRFDYIFKDTFTIKEAQIIQNEHGKIIIRIVKRPEFDSRTELQIKKDISTWISKTLKVEFEYVNEIERSKNGKFRAVLSKLK